jgi:hypothetical protein
MATFCADGWPEFTILVDGTDTIMVFAICLCVMFGFQPRSLHISKDVVYDMNNNVSSLMYQMFVITVQG